MERSLEDLASEASDECRRLWVQEAARRYRQLKAGTARSVSADVVFARLDARPHR
jgi:hypothetical protein